MKNQNDVQTIMIIDDMPENLEILGKMLSRRGFRIVSFTRGDKALDSLSGKKPDLIMLDIIMPDMNGFEVCRRLKSDEETREIPVIFISGLNDTQSKVQAFAEGGADYVTKPFYQEEVAARVKTSLTAVNLHRQLKIQNENLEKLVEKRTEELALANERLLQAGSLKNDFLQMISHDIRTPANGILGIGELITEKLPLSEENQMLIDLFMQSSSRLRNLIDDAAMIADMDNIADQKNTVPDFSGIMKDIKRDFSDTTIQIEGLIDLAPVSVRADCLLLKKALETMISLALCFSCDKKTIRVKCLVEKKNLDLLIELDNMSMTKSQTDSFFELESTARASSLAQALGLAPVAAQKILKTFGGSMKIANRKEGSGLLETSLVIVQP